MKTIYLCGPIFGCDDRSCKDWRNEIKKRLEGKYNFLDPMRRDFRGIETSNRKDIVENDLNDIRECDILLAFAETPSWGTAMEIFFAKTEGKRVVIFGNFSESPWLLFHSDAQYTNLENAISHLVCLK